MDITGKPMRGFVWASAEAADGGNLEQWILLAERYVGALPSKLLVRSSSSRRTSLPMCDKHLA
jgi:hypothetical protein